VCSGSYNFVKINKDEKICTNKCDGLQDCQSYESYIKNTDDNNPTEHQNANISDSVN
jgi:hypothetical protein